METNAMFSATIMCRMHQLLFILSLFFFICLFSMIFFSYIHISKFNPGFANQRAQGIKIDWKEFVSIYQSSE